jgi:glycosyltransferase involved in cell wall biosynthesis
MVSVIIPTYNRESTISRAIESALKQRGVGMELIVVDDGSVDGTKQVVSQYAQVKYVWQPNRRQAAARNHGLEIAKGEFVASLDSDDSWDEDFLSSSLEALHTTGADFVFSNHRICNENGEVSRPDYLATLPYMPPSEEALPSLSAEATRALFIRHCPAPSSSFLMPRGLVGRGWDEEARISDDWFLILAAVLEKSARCVVQRRPTWTKTLGNDNICDGHRDHLGLALKEIQDAKRLLQLHTPHLRHHEKREVARRLACSMDDAAYFAAKGGRALLMMAHQTRSFLTVPTCGRLLRFLRLCAVCAMSKVVG